MARKGTRKVKTGCITCKIRKVKCDEAKPECQRCTSTGRRCDGYPVLPLGQAAYSWDELVALRNPLPALARRMPPSLPVLDRLEARALDFFRLQVGPALAMHSSATFWRTLVLQVAQQEPAVRHALACIGSTYEALDQNPQGPLRLANQTLVLKQYNLALKHVSAPGVDKSIVLVVCLLFICIESMQENRVMAIEHCRHGIIISNEASGHLAPWAHELRPIFLRVATLPYFFGQETDFPQPSGFFPSRPLESLEEADADARSMAWDSLINRAVRLVRDALNNRRENFWNEPAPQHLLDEQREVIEAITEWSRYFKRLRSMHTGQNYDTFSKYVHFEIQCTIANVWANICLDSDAAMCDHFMPDFEHILRLTQQIIALKASHAGERPKFIFEMGWMPLLYFVIISCRRLDLRLIALRHAILLSCEREHLFNTKILYSVGLRIVELEHGIKLDPNRPEYEGAVAAPLPAHQVRIKSADITEEIEMRADPDGHPTEYRKVWFLIEPAAIVPGFMEWVKIGPCAARLTSLPSRSQNVSAGKKDTVLMKGW